MAELTNSNSTGDFYSLCVSPCTRLLELVHLVRGGADVEEDDLRVAVDEPPPAVDPVAALPQLLHRLA